jgi:RHS repeat-associated protein
LLARTDGNGSTFYHADGAGNVTALMDTQQNMAARYMYSAFGALVSQHGGMAGVNRIMFSSKPRLSQSDIYDFGQGDYFTSLQRRGSPDPLGVTFDTNPYRVNYNNPLSYVDPDGMAPQLVTVTGDLNGGLTGAGYVDYHAGQDYGIGLHGPLSSGGEIAMMTGATMVPGVGEAMDLSVLTDPESRWWELGLAGASLGLNALTDGLLPNAGGFLKAGKKACKAVDELKAAQRTAKENAKARNFFKNHKQAARDAWEDRTGQKWPKDASGNWPAEHTPPLKQGGDPMTVTPRDPGAPDPHNIPGTDGLTDYQRWGAMGTPARAANK